MVGKHHATSRKARRGDCHLAPCKGIREIFYCGIRNTVKFCLWNPESWVLESGLRNTQRGIQNPRLSWIPLHGASQRSHKLFVCSGESPRQNPFHRDPCKQHKLKLI